MTPEQIAAHIRARPMKGMRRLVALAGPPASGKSTLAHQIAQRDPTFCVVPMDGFHLDNAVLQARGLLARKGAPQTFDAQGLVHLMTRMGSEDEVVFPLFDRILDKSIAGAGVVTAAHTTVIVEGNYLLLNRAPWDQLHRIWDLSIRLDVPHDILRQRLLDRWQQHGYDAHEAARKADSNDIPNALTIAKESRQGDLTLS